MRRPRRGRGPTPSQVHLRLPLGVVAFRLLLLGLPPAVALVELAGPIEALGELLEELVIAECLPRQIDAAGSAFGQMRHVAGQIRQRGTHDPAIQVRHQLIALGGTEELCRCDDLSALVPTVLSQLPTDLFTGKPLVYHRTKDGYLLYSLGDNGFDDGGSNSLQNLLAGQTAEELGITYEEFEKKIPPTADDHALRVPTPKFKLPSPASN